MSVGIWGKFDEVSQELHCSTNEASCRWFNVTRAKAIFSRFAQFTGSLTTNLLDKLEVSWIKGYLQSNSRGLGFVQG